MEYLYRLLIDLDTELDFNYHPKCEKLKIISLWFDDDLLIFTSGDVRSIQLLMQFLVIPQATGLVARPTKCKMYFEGVEQGEKER